MATATTKTPDLPAASGLTGQTTDLPKPGEFPSLDAETQVPIIIGVASAFLALSTIMVLARLYTRYGLIKVAGDDDITIAVAQVVNIGLVTTTILQSAYGLGRHTWMVNLADRTKQLELLLASEIIYNAAQAMTKISLLLQYRRIFRGMRTRLVSLWLMVFVTVWCVISIVLDAFACTPMAILNPHLEGTCLKSLLVWSLTSAVNIVTNFAVVAVPIPATWALQLHQKQRIILTLLFGFGFCTGIVAIARILTVKNAALSLDVSWDSSPNSYFSVIEVNVGIVCACIITLRPLFAHLFPSLVKSSYASPGYYGEATAMPGTKKSSRDTMTHADHGIYGLADLEVNQVLNGSQEILTNPKFFEPAHFHDHHTMPRMSTSITSGGRLQSSFIGDRVPATKIQTRSGDIMVTRETTIREEKRAVSPELSEGSS
ncbi:hypothetical protein N0V93_005328 [Gnomoniopsis smithogilvyi]|uniref:Rhodopsin domain-containing protein n=1 Tax=Gnomoniopsis smithogilvyi TaxID=1191159 RepID=A0A9W8YU61_9PEZI|nr:hypothetical protein N0V93_005328 [Gnomoniopsis smithogilvyi]